jgi:outer membrane protein assembly factor BamD (BamD/ComL family)
VAIESNKPNYEFRIRDSLDRGDKDAAEAAARAAFKDRSNGESLLAWIAANMYEGDVRPAFELLEDFVNRFPNSLHLPRVYMSDVLSRADRFDQATDHARVYLRQAQEVGALANLAEHRFVQQGASRAFLLVTAAYTELGARSYSKRVLQYARQFAIAENWIETVAKEQLRLDDELKESDNKIVDDKWERFFSTGNGIETLYTICAQRKFPLMAKRLELIEESFRSNANFQVGEQEILLLVLVSKGNACALR